MYELKGTLKKKNDSQYISENFNKREFIVSVDGKIKQEIKLEFRNDNCDKLDSISIGEEVTVGFFINGRESKGNHYNTLVAFKID